MQLSKDTVTYAMADEDGGCPGNTGPCLHFERVDMPHDGGSGGATGAASSALMSESVTRIALAGVTTAYNAFVAAMDQAAKLANKVTKPPGGGSWRVALLLTSDTPRFGFTYHKTGDGHKGHLHAHDVHESAKDHLVDAWKHHQGKHGNRASKMK